MMENITPTTVMIALASDDRICLAASGEPLITHGGSRSAPWKAVSSMLMVTVNSTTAATLSMAGMSHRFVRSASSRQSDSTPSPRRVMRICLVLVSRRCQNPAPTRLPGSPAIRIAVAGAPSALRARDGLPAGGGYPGGNYPVLRSPAGSQLSIGK
jgi:hypothetical protein